MAEFARDSFSQGLSATTPLAGLAAELGGSWVTLSGASWRALTTGRAGYTTGTGAGVMYLNTPAPSPDYTVSADFRIVSSAFDSNPQVGICGRLDPAAANGITAYFVRVDLALQRWELCRYVGGSLMILGVWADTILNATTRPVALEMAGSALRVLVDGTSRITATDVEITAAGYVGIRAGRSLSSGYGVHLDTLGAATPEAAPDARTGTSAVAATGMVQATGGKHGAGAARAAATGAATAQGAKRADSQTTITGAGVVTAAGRKQGGGASAIPARGIVTATGSVGVVDARSGSSGVAARGVVQAGGAKRTGAPAAVSAAGRVQVAGRKLAVGTAYVPGRGALTGAGAKHAAGYASVEGFAVVVAAGWRPGGVAYLTGGPLELVPLLDARLALSPVLTGTLRLEPER